MSRARAARWYDRPRTLPGSNGSGIGLLHQQRGKLDELLCPQRFLAEHTSVGRRLSALSSFYRYCARHDLVPAVPTAGVTRPRVDPDTTDTVGLDRDQARALLAQAEKDVGRQRLRTDATVKLLLHNALRSTTCARPTCRTWGWTRGTGC
ncbi:hypothetical protein [Actinophytocola sp.]|uniref:hypothetical protein n=1 Tax=Actinophytocola sp. TaxID=1872138 RepID=UPI002ED464AE